MPEFTESSNIASIAINLTFSEKPPREEPQGLQGRLTNDPDSESTESDDGDEFMFRPPSLDPPRLDTYGFLFRYREAMLKAAIDSFTEFKARSKRAEENSDS